MARSSMQDCRRIEIPRIPFDFRSFAKATGMMRPEAVGWMLSANGTPFIRCECGLVLGLDETHTIAEDGVVSPSLHHEADDHINCGMHVLGRFVGWEKRSEAM